MIGDIKTIANQGVSNNKNYLIVTVLSCFQFGGLLNTTELFWLSHFL